MTNFLPSRGGGLGSQVPAISAEVLAIRPHAEASFMNSPVIFLFAAARQRFKLTLVGVNQRRILLIVGLLLAFHRIIEPGLPFRHPICKKVSLSPRCFREICLDRK